MKYKAIIFDFDGVLLDSERIHLQAANQVFFLFLAPEKSLFSSCEAAKQYLFKAILAPKNQCLGHGHGPSSSFS